MMLLLSGSKVLSLYPPRPQSNWLSSNCPVASPASAFFSQQVQQRCYSISSSGSRESSIFTASPASNACCVSVSLLQTLILFRLGRGVPLRWNIVLVLSSSVCLSVIYNVCCIGGRDWRVCVCARARTNICTWWPEVSIGCSDCFSTLFLRNSLSLNLELTHSAGLSRQRTQGSCYCCHPALETVVQCHDAWLLCEF